MRLSVTAGVMLLALGVAQGVRAAPKGPRTDSTRRSTSGSAHQDDVPLLSDEEMLAGVVSLYEAGKYGECAAGLSKLLKSGDEQLHEPDVLEAARIYHAACLIGAGRASEADEPLREAIRANMQMKPPDSLVFPPPVIERFLRVRRSLYDEIKRAEDSRVEQARVAAEAEAGRKRSEELRVRELERLASQETLVVRNRRWVATVPFGVGQFQNGDDGLGWVFLTGESALAATALTSLGMRTYLELQASRLKNEKNDAVLLTWTTLLRVSSWGLVAVASAGVLQAHLGYVPETRETRRRALPPNLLRKSSAFEWEPSFSATDKEWRVGISARF
jgi:hypothetical protein